MNSFSLLSPTEVSFSPSASQPSPYSPLIASSPPKVERPEDEQFAVYGIKIWRWRISFQLPRRHFYTRVKQTDDDEANGGHTCPANLVANKEFFRKVETGSNWEFEAFRRFSAENLIKSRSQSDEHIYAEIDSADVDFYPNPPIPPRYNIQNLIYLICKQFLWHIFSPCRSSATSPPSYPPYSSAQATSRGRSPRRRSSHTVDKVRRSKSSKH